MSTLEVNKLAPLADNGTVTLGDSGDTITVPTGVGLTVTDEVKTNKISPASGTAFTLGDSGDTFTIPSGATITNSGTATGFGGGKVGQVIQTVSTGSATISTTSFADVINTAITPSATSSKILIDFRLGGYNPGDAMDIFFRVERDSTALQTGTAGQGTACQSAGTPNSQRGDGGFSINFLDSPNSTSAITYKLQSKVSGNSYTFNSKSGSYSTISTVTLMEILA